MLDLIGIVPAFRGLKAVERAAWRVRRVLLAAVPPVLLIVAGALLIAGSPSGLELLLAEIVSGIALSAFNAWILLIEVRR